MGHVEERSRTSPVVARVVIGAHQRREERDEPVVIERRLVERGRRLVGAEAVLVAAREARDPNAHARSRQVARDQQLVDGGGGELARSVDVGDRLERRGVDEQHQGVADELVLEGVARQPRERLRPAPGRVEERVRERRRGVGRGAVAVRVGTAARCPNLVI